jgi:Patatin-like phospholipase
VLEKELEQVRLSRKLRLESNPPAHDAKGSLIGLAFSGGGIRSATFNLGVLQALAQKRLLHCVDYLSTVSGGGYIGSWLMGWLYHQKIGIHEVEDRLAPHEYNTARTAEPPEVRFLRSYSNYLTPRKGFLSADFWAFVASYLRNTFLNLTILLLLLLSLLLLPRKIVYIPHLFDKFEKISSGLVWLAGGDPVPAQYLAVGTGLLFGIIGIMTMGLNLCWVNPPKKDAPDWIAQPKPIQFLVVVPVFLLAALISYGWSQVLDAVLSWRAILWWTFWVGLALCICLFMFRCLVRWIARPWTIHVFIVAPLMLSAALLSYGLDQVFRFDLPREALLRWAFLLGLVLYFSPWLITCLVRSFARRWIWPDSDKNPANWVILLTALGTGSLCGLMLLPYALIVRASAGASVATSDTARLMGLWHVLIFGAPAFVGIMLLAGALHIGLMGRRFTDAYREWWARLGALLIIATICWLLLFLMAVYVPFWIGRLLARYQIAGVAVWLVSTIYGVLFGKSPLTGVLKADTPLKKKILGWAARATPYLFVLGMLAGMSVLAAWIAALVSGQPFLLGAAPSVVVGRRVFLACVIFAGAAAFLSWRVDINAFSTHMLYRNRLVRCYLGASVPKRREQPFTGFSAEDDVPLAKLQVSLHDSPAASHARPFPLLNTSLNVTRGKELALQTRKARSFVLSPAYSGYARPIPEMPEWQSAFGETRLAGSRHKGSERDITLGTAMAISGAAASPNMGFHSSPALAFLMTLFDVRLGWWMGNPRIEKGWRQGSPAVGFWWLLRELFGAASDDSDYVYLSDGGHFENLAIYELVRRRCKLIVACDASCDPCYSFDDLHNAMERCRSDFGVEIEVDTSVLAPQADRPAAHFAIGKIHYTPRQGRKKEREEDVGTLIYLKPVLCDRPPQCDPADLLGYKKKNGAFPHDSTANQWFDEDHFENYRNLGYVTALAASGKIDEEVQGVLGRSARKTEPSPI